MVRVDVVDIELTGDIAIYKVYGMPYTPYTPYTRSICVYQAILTPVYRRRRARRGWGRVLTAVDLGDGGRNDGGIRGG